MQELSTEVQNREPNEMTGSVTGVPMATSTGHLHMSINSASLDQSNTGFFKQVQQPAFHTKKPSIDSFAAIKVG